MGRGGQTQGWCQKACHKTMWGGVFSIRFGGQQPQTLLMDAGKCVMSPQDKDADPHCPSEASLSCPSSLQTVLRYLLGVRCYSRHWTQVGPSSEICTVKSSRELTAKMLGLYFATVLLGGKIFEVACPSVLGWCWESTLPVLISSSGHGSVLMCLYD